MTPPYLAHTTTADARHAKASAAKRLRSNGHLGYCGSVFKLDSLGKETVLHAFRGWRSGGDGATPLAPLIADPQGNLYGTTNNGGMQGGCRVGLMYQGCGTVYELYAGGVYKVLYEFPAGGQSGINPQAGLVRDGNGNLYGTTTAGGAHNAGAVFKLTPW